MKFTELEEAIVALGEPIASVDVAQLSSGLSRNIDVMILFAEGTEDISDALLMDIIRVLMRDFSYWNKGVLVISFFDESIKLVDISTVAENVGVAKQNRSVPSELTFYQYSELESLVASWE